VASSDRRRVARRSAGESSRTPARFPLTTRPWLGGPRSGGAGAGRSPGVDTHCGCRWRGIFEKTMRGVRQDSPADPRQGIGSTTFGWVGRCEGVDDALDGAHPATSLRAGRGWRHRPGDAPSRTTCRGRHLSWTKARRGCKAGTKAPVPPSVRSAKVSPLETGPAKTTAGRGRGQRPAADGRARRTTKSMGTPQGAP